MLRPSNCFRTILCNARRLYLRKCVDRFQCRLLTVDHSQQKTQVKLVEKSGLVDEPDPEKLTLTEILSDNVWEDSLRVCDHLISRTIRAEEWEMIEVKEVERAQFGALASEDLAWRGLALNHLTLDSSYVKLLHSRGEVEIRLKKSSESDSVLYSRVFRIGKTVVLIRADSNVNLTVARDFENGKDWRVVKGTVSSSDESFIYIQLPSLSDSFILDGLSPHKPEVRVHLVKPSEAGIVSISLRALRSMDLEKLNPQLVDLFVGKKFNASESADLKTLKPQRATIFRSDFDASKRQAIHLAADRHPLTIIHGPPGTGKTTALAAAILSAVMNGERVLACAPSHAAVDALTKAIVDQWPRHVMGDPVGQVLRVGFDLKITMPELDPYLELFSIDSRCIDREAIDLVKSLKKVREELVTFVKQNRSELFEEEARIGKLLRYYKRDYNREFARRAKVVLSTNHAVINKSHAISQIESGKFDLVCIDEAAFATHANILPLALRAKRLILSGDHFQLPPVITSDRARADGLNVSLMEIMAKRHPDRVALLTTQYRSNALISGWSSGYYYKGLLKADHSVAKIQLCDLPDVKPCPDTRKNLIFIDTSGANFSEVETGTCEAVANDDSHANYDEAFVAEAIVRKYISYGVQPKHIGLIAPYWSQVSLLRTLLWDGPSKFSKVTIKTIDGYQGGEKELIIISMVRSNKSKSVGFLSETRRLNVSVTRAKHCLIVIGDIETLSSDPGLKSFINYCRSKDAIVPVKSVL